MVMVSQRKRSLVGTVKCCSPTFCGPEYVSYFDGKYAQPKGCATGAVASGVLRLVRTLNFGEGFGAALADGGIAGVFADVRRIVPAALAFCAVGAFDFNC